MMWKREGKKKITKRKRKRKRKEKIEEPQEIRLRLAKNYDLQEKEVHFEDLIEVAE
jgi:uncharacterized protein YggL (DUF469 family)